MTTAKATPPPSNKNPLLVAPVSTMIRKIGLPVAIGATFNTLFNVVDTIYGGLISDQALAALSISFPIYFIIVALGFGFSQGNTALIGNALGRGNREEAEKYAIQGISFGIIISIITTVVVLPILPNLVAFMGATDPEYQRMALDYINMIFYGAIFFITVQMLSSILNALGNTIPSRNFLVGGFFLNLLFDPWFIFGGFGLPPLGIAGIGLATISIQALGCIYVGYFVAKTDLVTAVTLKKYLIPRANIVWRIIQQGLPNTLDLMGVSLGFFVLTFFVSKFGPNAVAALGAASRLEQVALLPLLGLNVAVISLVAQNNGAQLYNRVQETFRKSIQYGSAIMLVTTVLVSLFARPLMQLFTDDPEIIQIGVEYVWIRNLGLIPTAIFFMSSSALRGIERPLLPLIYNMFRFVILPWLFIIIFVQQMGMGLTAIWITSTSAFFITAVVGYITARRLLPQPN
ncbi:MAG: MATE family efflux transporter [Chloroflexota bacterium]